MIVSAKARYANAVPKPLGPRHLDDRTVVDVPIPEVHRGGKGGGLQHGAVQGRHSAAPRHGSAGPPRAAAQNSRLCLHRQLKDRVSAVGGLPRSADPGRELAP